jgi:rhodanese-related sulfurtransferase
MRALLSTILCLGLFFFEAQSQKKVSNQNFDNLLKVLLKNDVKELTIPEAARRKNALFLDAREKKEYDVSHIRSSLYVGYNTFDLALVNNVAKESEIIVYCSIGKRSENIAQRLKKAGYTNVSNLYGGIFEWVNQGNAVVDSNNKPTDKVHAYGWYWGRWLVKGEKVYN